MSLRGDGRAQISFILYSRKVLLACEEKTSPKAKEYKNSGTSVTKSVSFHSADERMHVFYQLIRECAKFV